MIKPSTFMSMGEKLRNNSSLLYSLVAAITAKVFLFFWASNSFDYIINPQNTFWDIWYRWDSLAYITIATGGYFKGTLAPDYFGFLSHFPPLYSMCISITYWLTHGLSLIHI